MTPVVAAVCIRRGRVLLAKRPDGKHLAGLWEFPGGKLEAGEDPLTALRRELHEELAVTLVSADPWLFTFHRYADRDVLLLFYLVRIRGRPRPQEGNHVRWQLISRIRASELPPGDLPALKKLRRDVRRRAIKTRGGPRRG